MSQGKTCTAKKLAVISVLNHNNYTLMIMTDISH